MQTSIASSKKQRVMFTPEDDKKLRALVKNYTTKPNWNEICQHFENKTARQCRERYNTYLRPEISQAEWTPEEDQLLREKVKEYGNHWAKLKQFFPGRSDNMIKNRYNFHINPIRKLKEKTKKTFDNKSFVLLAAAQPKDQKIAIQRSLPINFTQIAQEAQFFIGDDQENLFFNESYEIEPVF